MEHVSDMGNVAPAAGIALVAAAAIAALVQWQLNLVVNLLRYLRRPREKGDSRFPPLAPVTMREALSRLMGRDAPLFVLDLSRRVGPVYRLPLGPGCGTVVVCDHESARGVLDDRTVAKPKLPYRLFDHVAGADTSFFTTDDGRWRHVRKATATAFGPRQMDRMGGVVRRVLDRFVDEVLDPKAKAGDPIDVAPAMQRITTRVIAGAGFGYDMREEEVDNFLLSFQLTYWEYGRMSAFNPLRRALPFLFPGARRARRASSDLRSLCRRMLSSYRSDPNDASGTVIAAMVGDEAYTSDEERISDMIVFLAGGFDTTAYTLAWALLELARNPEEQRYLADDLARHSPSSSSLSSSPTPGGGTATAAAAAAATQSPALQNVVREALRLHATAAQGSVREFTDDGRIGGYPVPKGTWAVMPYLAIHRNGRVFEHPDEFLPRRWEGEDAPPASSLVGFASGRRGCIGQGLAMAELHTVLARLCAEYEWSVVEEGTYDYFVTWKTVGSKLLARRRQQ